MRSSSGNGFAGLFVFPDIKDVAPTDGPDVVRVFCDGTRPYPGVCTVELRQQGFDLPLVYH